MKSIVKIWHTTFEDEAKHYSEFESSDIEYFIGCMLYNHFNFENALDTMKTIDLSYDFLLSVEENYDEVKNFIDKISLDDELEKITFLNNFLNDAKSKYSEDELYLINRLSYHLDGVKQRYDGKIQAQKVDFQAPKAKSKNPLAGV